MVWRSLFRALVAAHLLILHALLLSLLAFHKNASLFFLGVFILGGLMAPRAGKVALVVTCRVYHCLVSALTLGALLVGSFLLAFLLIVGSLRDDAGLHESAWRLFQVLFGITVGGGVVSALIEAFRDFVEGRRYPTIPSREDKVIPREAAFNAADLKALEKACRKGKRGGSP